MIPSGYVDSLVAWAQRPDLTDAVRTARQQQLLDEHDRLVTGQLTGKAGRYLLQGALNGKSFQWAPEVLASEKLVVITAVLNRLGLLSEDAKPPSMSYGDFSGICR